MSLNRKRSVSRNKLRPRLESLEDRVVMTLGPVFTVARTSLGDYMAASASSNNGTKVVAWLETNETSGGRPLSVGLEVQKFDNAGHALSRVVEVASTSDTTQSFGPVAIAEDGGGVAVVAYTLTTNGHSNVYAVRLNSGLGVTNRFTVAVYTNSWANSTEPSVAMSPSSGHGFVISFTSQYGSAYYQSGVYARRYDASANNVQFLYVAAASNSRQRMSHAAMDAYGDFDVAYMTAVGTGNSSVYLRTFSSSGVALRTLGIETLGQVDYSPSLSMDNAGDAVVTWYEINGAYRNVYFRTLSRTGTLGSTVAVTNTTAQALSPSVAMNPFSGSFVIAYSVGFSNSQVFVKEYSNTGILRANYWMNGPQTDEAAVSIDGSGNYLFTFRVRPGSGPTFIQAANGHLS